MTVVRTPTAQRRSVAKIHTKSTGSHAPTARTIAAIAAARRMVRSVLKDQLRFFGRARCARGMIVGHLAAGPWSEKQGAAAEKVD
jgi:hypothetical protein